MTDTAALEVEATGTGGLNVLDDATYLSKAPAGPATTGFRPFFNFYFYEFDRVIPPYLLDEDHELISSGVPMLDDIPPAVLGASNYDSDVADLLAFASTWAYADPATFSFMMARRGLRRWKCLCMGVVNPPLFVVATAYLIQSPDRDVAILIFRGTEPQNILNWMTDLSVSPERFIEGRVHGGIFRNLQALWPLVHKGLRIVEDGGALELREAERGNDIDLRDRAQMLASRGIPSEYRLRRPVAGAHENVAQHNPPLPEALMGSQSPLKALYITGHSLGGAMAALAAAEIWKDAKYRRAREKLCGVYTYGAPMIAAPELAEVLDKSLGHAVFRHVYDKDLVPRLPPLSAGRFEHFGKEYRSNGGGNGWEFTTRNSSQVWSASSLLVGAVAWATAQLPLLSNIRLPVSWDHHSPRYYTKVSNLSLSERL